MSIFEKSVSDYFSGKFLSLSFVIFLVPMCIFGILLVTGANEIIDIFTQGANTGDFSFLSENEYPFLTAILKFAVVKWIVVTLFYSLGVIFVVLFSLLVAMIILGLLTPMVVKTVHKKHYAHKPPPQPMENIKVYKILSINILKFLALFLISIPFMWIPLVINLPFFYLFYKLVIVDVASNMMSEEKFNKIKKEKFGRLIFLSLCFFVLSLIPIAGIFLQLFFAIYFTHFFFEHEPSTEEPIILKNDKFIAYKND